MSQRGRDDDIEKIKKEFTVIQHPAAIIPLGISAISFILVIAGAGVPALVVGGVSAAVGGGSIVWRFIHSRGEYEEKVRQIMDQRARSHVREEQERLDSSCERIHNGFLAIESKTGTSAVQELRDAHASVIKEIELMPEGDYNIVLTTQVKPLVKNTFDEGLTVLSCALDLMRGEKTISEDSLRLGIARLEKEIAGLKNVGDEDQAKLIKIKESSLALQRGRLQKLTRRRTLIEELMHQADYCEEVLQNTREDLIRLRVESSEEALNEVMRRLQDCIATAVQVQDNFKKSLSLSV